MSNLHSILLWKSKSVRLFTEGIIAVSVFALAVGASSGRVGLEVRVDWPWRPHAFSPRRQIAPGHEMVMAYVGASSCGPSNSPELPAVIETLKQALSTQAISMGMQFMTIGIAKDITASLGLQHLQKFGAFDEIAAGNAWYNNAARKYVSEDLVGLPATPQVVVTTRDVVEEGGGHKVMRERLVVRKVGVSEIANWVKAGAPMPNSVTANLVESR
jgi:hypothetical protein